MKPEINRAAQRDATSKVGAVAVPHIAADLRALAVPIDSLRPMPGNARLHGERDLSALGVSLTKYRQRRPIVAKAMYRGTERVIIAGCGTWMAAKMIGWPSIATSWFDGSDSEAAAYSVLDNRIAELSAWNPGALAALQADGGLDLLELWHDDAGLADLLRDAAPVPHFEPVEAAHRLDQLAPDTTCPVCGHAWRQDEP